MKNIFLSPTDKPSRLCIDYKNNLCLSESDFHYVKSNEWKTFPQNIYIISHEKIKDKDWCINLVTKGVVLGIGNENFRYYKDWKKIILTTDQDLIKDGVQAINDEFLEWFVKNANESGVPFDRCEVEEVYPLFCCIQKEGKTKKNNGCMERNRCVNYKITIPQEEPRQDNCCTHIGQIKRYVDCVGCDRKPKQETLEEAKQRILDSNYMTFNDADIFEMGVKWQAERMYSEEEVFSLLTDLVNSDFIDFTKEYGIRGWDELNKWFEQNKKK